MWRYRHFESTQHVLDENMNGKWSFHSNNIWSRSRFREDLLLSKSTIWFWCGNVFFFLKGGGFLSGQEDAFTFYHFRQSVWNGLMHKHHFISMKRIISVEMVLFRRLYLCFCFFNWMDGGLISGSNQNKSRKSINKMDNFAFGSK